MGYVYLSDVYTRVGVPFLPHICLLLCWSEVVIKNIGISCWPRCGYLTERTRGSLPPLLPFHQSEVLIGILNCIEIYLSYAIPPSPRSFFSSVSKNWPMYRSLIQGFFSTTYLFSFLLRWSENYWDLTRIYPSGFPLAISSVEILISDKRFKIPIPTNDTLACKIIWAARQLNSSPHTSYGMKPPWLTNMFSMLLSEPGRIFDQLHMTVTMTNLLLAIPSFLVGTFNRSFQWRNCGGLKNASLSGHP